MRNGFSCGRALGAAAFLAAVLAGGVAERLRAGEQLVILPPVLQLEGAGATHRVVVQQRDGERIGGQVAEDVVFESSDPDVARVERGVVTAVGDGQATITATRGGQTATAAVTVTGVGQSRVWSFRNHVQSVFTKSGCNSGSCHGALAGKGGFKLSLRGYDTDGDYLAITRQARGRRVELPDPGRSLVLAKPSGALPHKGGVRFETDSLEYEVVSRWIAEGIEPPRPDDRRIQRIEVFPPVSIQQPERHQQLVVQARFSDGSVEDVTRWAKFASTNETVAKVDDQGKVEVIGHGEGAVTAWYLSKIVIARVVSPYPAVAATRRDPDAPGNFIDEMIDAKLAELNLVASPPAGDGDFLRRAFLDTIGTLPTADESRRFLEDASAGKREALVDALLERPEFIDYWTYRWCDLLLVNGKRLRPAAVNTYYGWLRKAVEEHRPWDELAREVVTATGSSLENGATNFFALHQDPLEISENVSVAFLGLNINCARCHNHPLEKWTNDQYYAMANLFSRVRAKGWGGDARSGDGERTVYVVDSGELIQPLSGKAQPPTPLDGTPIAFDAPGDRRRHLAEWLTADDNPYFSRAIANRIWANYFGVGLVEPVDDLRVSNPASNEPLLTAAARFLIEHDYDTRELMRAILKSRAYGRSSRPVEGNRDDERFYARYYPRRLMAEVLLDAISQITTVPTAFNERNNSDSATEKIDDYPLGTRAIQLRDSAVASEFLTTFGRNERAITCECERSNEPSMVQVLHIANGDTINAKLRVEKNRVSELMETLTNAEIIDEVYLACLSRFPGHAERQSLLDVMNASPDERRLLVEDLFWSVMSSREFLFNH